MSERNWGIIVAAGLGVVSFSAVGGFMLATQAYDQHEERVGSSADPGQRRDDPQQADTDHAGVPSPIERLISNPEPDEGTQREKRDLAAQENTAAWAFWIVLFTAVQAILSGFGIYFIVQTLRHSQKVSDAQLRAYVGFHPGEKIEQQRGFWRARIKVENFGQTPAVDMQTIYMVFYLPFPLSKPLPDFPEDYAPLNSAPLMPGQSREVWTGGIVITPAQQLAIATFRACIVTRLHVIYHTYSGERIERPPLCGINYADTGMGTAALDERHFIGGPFPNHNAVDADPDPDDEEANQPRLL